MVWVYPILNRLNEWIYSLFLGKKSSVSHRKLNGKATTYSSQVALRRVIRLKTVWDDWIEGRYQGNVVGAPLIYQICTFFVKQLREIVEFKNSISAGFQHLENISDNHIFG